MAARWELDRTINITEGAALVVGLVALGFSLFNFWFIVGREPRLTTLPPRQVIILAQDYPARGSAVVRFAAHRQHINERRFGGAAIVTDEILQVALADDHYRYVWQAIGNFKVDGQRLLHQDGAPPTAAVVRAGEAIGHEAYYAGATRDDIIEWEPFLDALEKLGAVDLTFVSLVHGQPDLEYSCRVSATTDLLEVLRSRTWAAPLCVPSTN